MKFKLHLKTFLLRMMIVFLLLLLFQCIYLFFIKKRLIEGTGNITKNNVKENVEKILENKSLKKPNSKPKIDGDKMENNDNFDLESKAKNKEDDANKKMVEGGLVPSRRAHRTAQPDWFVVARS